jgi:predicted TIM-barrel fold metal-dependent hydrolase
MSTTPTARESYANGRRLLDADSHIMELPNFLAAHADPDVRDRLPEIDYSRSSVERDDVLEILANGGRHERPYAEELRASGDQLIRGAKEEKALGAFDRDDRSAALDLLGFEKQLVFSTLSGTVVFDHRLDLDLQYAAARAHNRGMTEFCADDARLLPVASIPLSSPDLACTELERVLESEPGAVWVPHKDCGGRSPGHADLDPFWARLQEAKVPFVLHVGGFPLQVPQEWANTGRPAPRDWMGGGENVRGKDFTVLHHAPERFVSTMVVDGVFERFPKLQGAAVELGAGWAPALLTRLDETVEIFGRSEPALRAMKRSPSEQLRAQFAFTPFPFEDVGRLIRETDSSLYLFSSDYPHAEGGRDPLGRFDRSLEGFEAAVRTQFECGNFERVFGSQA